MPASKDQQWPEERVTKLLELFYYRGPEGDFHGPDGQQYSRDQLAQKLGMTKCAVQGKLGRLGLTDRRNSPIHPHRTQCPADYVQVRRYPKGVPSLPPLPSLQGVQAND